MSTYYFPDAKTLKDLTKVCLDVSMLTWTGMQAAPLQKSWCGEYIPPIVLPGRWQDSFWLFVRTL